MANDQLLVVIDPTADEQPGLQRAAWLAERLGAPLELFICAYDPYLAGTRFYDSEGLERLRERFIDDQRERLRALAAEHGQGGLEIEIDVRWDYPLDQGIARKASESAPALVVKDTHYHPVLKRSIFSNTDWNLIRKCPASLLLVKPRAVSDSPTVIAAVDPVHRHDKPAKLDHLIVSAAENLVEAIEGNLYVFHSFDPAPSVSAAAYGVPPLGIDVQEIIDSVRERHKQALDELLARYRSVAQERVEFRQGPPHLELLAVAEDLNADFVVMGSVSRSALDRMLVGSTAERVLDWLPCDLLLVNSPSTEE